MAVMTKMLFWVVTPCGLVGNASEKHAVCLSLEDGDNGFFPKRWYEFKNRHNPKKEHRHINSRENIKPHNFITLGDEQSRQEKFVTCDIYFKRHR